MQKTTNKQVQNSINNGIKIINLAIRKNLSVSSSAIELGYGKNYISDILRHIDKNLDKGFITQMEFDSFKKVHQEYSGNKKGVEYKIKSFSKNTKPTKKIKSETELLENLSEEELKEVVYDAYEDEKFDKRSIGEAIRGEDGKITGYKYKILIHNSPALEGTFTNDEMEKIYNLYSASYGANLTIRAVSREFPTLTFIDIKRILRAFNITKSSIPVSPHILEGLDIERVAELVLKNKEHNLFKYLEDKRGQHFEKLWIDSVKKLSEIKHSNESLKEIIKNLSLENVKPFKIEKKSKTNKAALFVYIADAHVGAKTIEDSVYNNDYDEKEFNKRLTATLQKIKEQHDIFGRFEKVIIFNMGDCLDGFNGQTTRGGHHLPQNMNNKEQFNVYVNGMINFFETLYELDVTNEIEFHSVGNDNHSGDMGYIANKSLEYIFNVKYPEMNVRVFEKFIETVEFHSHTFIISHGKDKENMKSGFPLHLDAKTETYFNEYINNFRISTPYIHVIKGDLHQSSSQQGKRFRYKNVSSLYGSSDWIHTNFGYTRPAVDFDIVFKDSGLVLEGTIDLR